MAKKKIISTILAVLVIFLCSGLSFATSESKNNNSINLGNEIMQSVDKTGDSFNNMVSGNTIKDAGNSIKNGMNNMMDGAENVINSMGNGMNNMINNENNTINNDGKDNIGTVNTVGDYNTVRTDVQGTTNNLSTMTVTTWMWIILVVAAIVIIAAIWYYATQNNS